MAGGTPVKADAHGAGLRVAEDGTARCMGLWTLPHLASLETRLEAFLWTQREGTAVDASGIEAMDTAGAWMFQRLLDGLRREGLPVPVRGLRPDVAALVEMVSGTREKAAPAAPRAEAGRGGAAGPLERIGRRVWRGLLGGADVLAFTGESVLLAFRGFSDPRRIRWRSVLGDLQEGGAGALPIIGMLAFLMGVVIAYQGAEQLREFGADIYIVDLVGISVLREIAPLVTAIIVAGRSGSAYAAQIGSMKITEELDALRTIRVPPMELLVLPRVLALVVALPLLTVFADVSGVAGGMLMANVRLDIGLTAFLDRFGEAVPLRHFLAGVVKAPVFAAIIALVGCYQGFRVGGGTDAVGRHTTMSVVQGISLVVVADAAFSILFDWAGL